METNRIYTRQFAVLCFIMSFTYKVSRLPPLIAEAVGSSGTFLVFLYLIPEVLSFLIIYRFMLTDGLNSINETVAFKAISAVFAVNFFFKAVLMFTGTVLFTMELMFENIAPYEVIITLIVPIAYMAYKGVRVISRVAEVCIWIVVLVLLTNIIFIKANLDFDNNLPLLNGSFGDLLTTGDKFFFWFGDFTPFIYVTLKKSKRGAVGLSLTAGFLMIIACFVLMFALYGDGAKYISNFVVKIASFNQFASKLGRLDWTGMIAWLLMSLIYLATYLWAFAEASSHFLKNRNFALSLGTICLLITMFTVKDISLIIDFAVGGIRWLAVAANYGAPAILLFIAVLTKRKNARPKEGMLDSLA